jgi:hypothetical protein
MTITTKILSLSQKVCISLLIYRVNSDTCALLVPIVDLNLTTGQTTIQIQKVQRDYVENRSEGLKRNSQRVYQTHSLSKAVRRKQPKINQSTVLTYKK